MNQQLHQIYSHLQLSSLWLHFLSQLVLFSVVLTAFFASLIIPIVLAATPGDLDPNFGNNGVVTTTIIGANGAGIEAIAIQPDNKIVVVGTSFSGSNGSLTLARYTTQGNLDNTFGNDGIVTTSINSITYGNDIAIQADGKILVTGSSSKDFLSSDLTLVRYTITGTLDNAFGHNGIVTTAIGDASVGNAVVIQSDNKIIVAGTSNPFGGSTFALARYTITGSLDSTFGNSGIITTTIGENGSMGNDVIIQPDGKIVVAGHSYSIFTGSTVMFALARYKNDGNLDDTFGNGGIVTTTSGIQSFGYAVALQADSKILVTGDSSNNGSTFSIALVRYESDGDLDNTFSGSGVVTTPIGITASGVDVVEQDGKILVLGNSADINFTDDFALVRYGDDGSLDSTFGNNGVITTTIGSGRAIAIQTDGKILAGGVGNGFFVLARYLGEQSTIYLPLTVKN